MSADVDAALFRFRFRRAVEDVEGYYFTRWDQAVPITVVAADEAEAYRKARAASGTPRGGKRWTFRLDGFDEEPAS